MGVRATVLCENSVFGKIGAIAEHGWSVFLETDYGNILLDTGQGKAITNNIQIFNIDLSTLNGIVLSHNHLDHTGGLLNILDFMEKVNVYAHPDIFSDCYMIDSNEEIHVGMPFSRSVLEGRGAVFQFNTEYKEIISGLSITGEVPRLTSFEKGDNSLMIKTENGYEKDHVLSDQSVIIETPKGLFIVLGCSHGGIINILRYAVEKTGQKHIHTIIGGTHLGQVGNEQVDESIKFLKEFDIGRIGVSHCTGLKTSMRLEQEFGDRFFFCNVGTVIEI